ncbi:MAG: HlyD family secretion protein [Arcobacter sp.]|uniref:hypothetical protein n=1 Tax=uncultured Arcobacter sp. TaxID=165434 RepID=UPI000CACCF5A|nr:hypothetical protein [uncultured Arcobacter sp.]PLY10402.1 MAG: HlyD family secretion protein [Arcobacter sp.]
MKIISFILLFTSFVFGMEYYSKLEPYNSYVIKSAVSGKVIFSNDKIEGKSLNKKTKIVEIDNSVDKIDLAQTQKKLDVLNSMLEIQEKNYNRLYKISSKSAFEKDNQKIQVLNLQSSKSDLLIKIATLKDTIKNKLLFEDNMYIYNISVKQGDYVTPGTLLYEAKDLTKGKLEIYIPISDYEIVSNKTIYMNGEKTDLKINKIYKVADSKHISSYKCEILIDDPKTFSRLVKIEFK